MTTVSVLLLWLLSGVFVPAPALGGSELEPVKHELQLIYLFEGPTPEFIFVIGQSGFKSVASLEEHLKKWAPGREA